MAKLTQEQIAASYHYLACNDVMMRAGKNQVGMCESCRKDWGLRHYLLDLPVVESVKFSKILCTKCAVVFN